MQNEEDEDFTSVLPGSSSRGRLNHLKPSLRKIVVGTWNLEGFIDTKLGKLQTICFTITFRCFAYRKHTGLFRNTTSQMVDFRFVSQELVSFLLHNAGAVMAAADWMNAVSRHGPFLPLGDFNAGLHKMHACESHLIGPHTFGNKEAHLNAESDRSLLLEMCKSPGLFVANTGFDLPVGKQVTKHNVGSLPAATLNSCWWEGKASTKLRVSPPARVCLTSFANHCGD